MAWRLAQSLVTLKNQLDEFAPNRSRTSDGGIGDATHQAVPSDHNPNKAGVVCAYDFTHDPAGGLDSYALADRLLAIRHPDLKYLISNRRIAGAWTNWRWVPYSGTADPHTNHAHVSVGVGDDGQSLPPYDDSTPWNVTDNKEDDMYQGKTAQEWAAIAADGEKWKQVGMVFSWRPEWPAMGGTPGNPDADPHSVKVVLDDLQDIKKRYLALDKGQLSVVVGGTEYVPKK